MFESVDDINISYEEDGVLVVKEVEKVILSKGAWATIVFKYLQWDPKTSAYGPIKYTIRRFRKIKGEYKAQQKMNISSRDQAKKLVEVLQTWLEQDASSYNQDASNDNQEE